MDVDDGKDSLMEGMDEELEIERHVQMVNKLGLAVLEEHKL
jgi:hypothetical protein